MNVYQAEILTSEKLGQLYHLLIIKQPDIALTAKPGQFVYLKGGKGLDPLLPRPLSIHQLNQKEGTIQLLFQLKGKGTIGFSKMKTGDLLTVLGPLGNGFSLADEGQNIVIIGGGIGVAPLLYLAEKLQERHFKPIIILGFRDKENIVAYESFSQLGCQLIVATEDGSFGRRGRVTGVLEEIISSEKIDVIYACGPQPMLKAVQKVAEKWEVENCQLSLEARMGCGLGACMACVCGVRLEDGQFGYRRVCSEGPVFNSREVLFDE
ncbi:MAG TPA: dihydroorotate dehydrogenase electron transfer subunit [Clostridia bacterium]|nr:dihydroorotate dehydrogenase electron transfer subunit [Clostridia bacterium]